MLTALIMMKRLIWHSKLPRIALRSA